MKVCVDASLVLKWLIPEGGSQEALSLHEEWFQKDVQLFAPALLDFEVATTLRQKILRGLLHSDDLYLIYDFYRRLNLLLIHPVDLASKTLAIAATIGQPTVYDVSYLLLAKEQGIDFVTADKKFYDAASPLFPFVKFYSDKL